MSVSNGLMIQFPNSKIESLAKPGETQKQLDVKLSEPSLCYYFWPGFKNKIIILEPHFHYAETWTFSQKSLSHWLLEENVSFFPSRNRRSESISSTSIKDTWVIILTEQFLQDFHLYERRKKTISVVCREAPLCSPSFLSSVLGNPVTIWQHLKMTVLEVIGQCHNRITANVRERTHGGTVI